MFVTSGVVWRTPSNCAALTTKKLGEGAVVPLTQTPKRATDLVTTAAARTDSPFDLSQMLDAPQGRVDAFGVGKDPAQPEPAAAPAN